MALLRVRNGLWLLGATFVAFLQALGGPNSVGAYILRHFCDPRLTPCNWLGRVIT